MAHDSLEAQTQAFLRRAQLEDPERYAALCARYPVKTSRELRSIAEIEIPAGLQPQMIAKRLRVKPIRTRHDLKVIRPLEEAS